MEIRGFENWKEVVRQTADDGTQLAIFFAGSYRITVSEASYMPGGLRIDANLLSYEEYAPEIYVDDRHMTDFQRVRIQTTSWGALEVSEIDKVIAAYAEAQKVAHEIEMTYPDCFKPTGTKEGA
jgi:2,4-dienoyl-CoA reductase-like NADH-dependent reductase (Old Yellow Enzyme family)